MPDPEPTRIPCPECEGAGYFDLTPPGAWTSEYRDCSFCHGSGKLDEHVCEGCLEVLEATKLKKTKNGWQCERCIAIDAMMDKEQIDMVDFATRVAGMKR